MSVFIPLELFLFMNMEKNIEEKRVSRGIGKIGEPFLIYCRTNFPGAHAHHGGYDTPYPFHIDVFINGLRPTLPLAWFPILILGTKMINFRRATRSHQKANMSSLVQHFNGA